MEHIVGISGLLCVAVLTSILAHRHPHLFWMLLTAYALRAGAALFHFYIAPLPDSTADALYFERIAWQLSQGSFRNDSVSYLLYWNLSNSWLISHFYALFGRSLLMAQSLSVLAGMGGVYLAWVVTKELWNERAAMWAGWAVALFPTLVLYSALTMREAYVVVFLLFGLLGVVRWVRQGRIRDLLLALVGLVFSGMFHGGMYVAVLTFLVIVVAKSFFDLFSSKSTPRYRATALVLLLTIVMGAIWFEQSGYRLPKVDNYSRLFSPDSFIRVYNRQSHALTKFPEWIIPNSSTQIVWKSPVRAIYFLFSPFPWELTQPRHLLGLFDALLYLGLVVLCWQNRRAIWSDPGARAVLAITLALILAFSLGTFNSGTGLRHRCKLVVGLIILAAPVWWGGAGGKRAGGRGEDCWTVGR